MFTVKQISQLAGITPRTLHHYDAIGLLKPTQVGENGYRYYSEETLLHLQQILLYRELDMPLEDIKRILADRDFDVLRALENHRGALRKRIAHMERLIDTVDQTIAYVKGEKPMSKKQLFKAFTEEEQAEMEKQAVELYDPETVKASSRRWKSYSAEEKQRVMDEGHANYQAFIDAMPKGPTSPEAQAIVERWRKHMDYFWTPNLEQLVGIANGYVDDPAFRANFDAMHPNLAEFVRDAVTEYVKKQKK